MRALASAAVFALCCLCVVGVSQAAPLNLSNVHYPIVFSGYISISYVADAEEIGGVTYGRFTAIGYPEQINDGSTTTDLDSWDEEDVFSLTAIINPSTGEPVSGELTVVGDLDLTLGKDIVTLFSSSTLVDFGFVKEDKFEFLFTQAGDTMLGGEVFVPDGATVGVILDGRDITLLDGITDPFPGIDPHFTEDFIGDGLAISDTFHLPEPSTVILLGVGAMALVRSRFRRG